MESAQTKPVAVLESGANPASPRSQALPDALSGSRRVPELLAPAGDWNCAKAAVENGADAIYFGLEKFNARMRAHNFSEGELPALMEYLHRRGVKGYVTFNTLIFENEISEAEEHLRAIIAAGADAAIVQDVGICRLIRRLSPDFPIHASTQMTITSSAGVDFARELGCQLVVLARECSLKEIEKIRTAPVPLPLEVFVHGALCVAYSGQCLTSEALGGRSANRGECAQACRLPYELISDGKAIPLGNRKYLLSPQDLAGLDVVPELVRSGVASLKIEGRLKSPEYVANITRIYRKALDETVDGARAGSREVRGTRSAFCSSRPRYEMEMAFSRGLYTGWFRGIDNQALVHAQYGKKRGVYLGEVLRVEREKIVIELQAPVKPGDGVVFDAGKPEEKEEGGRVYQVRAARSGDRHSKPEFQIPNSEVSNPNGGAPNGKPTVLAFGKGDIDFSRVHAGDKVWKTSDPELESRLQESFAGDEPRFQRPIRMEVHGRAGQSLTLVVRDEEGHVARVASAMILSRADKQPLSAERLRRQLGRLGGTGFELSDLSNSLEGAVLLPISELNRLRRLAVNELQTLRSRPKRWKLIPCQRRQGPGVQAPADVPAVGGPATPAREGNLIVLVRDLRQLETAIASGVETVYCEFENPRKYREAVTLFRRSPGGGGRRSVFVAPPRIFKEGEEWTLEQVRSCEADGYLIRNYEHLRFFANQRCVGDFSLNIANHLSADYFKNGFGLERLTASYDLNFTQLEALLRAAPPEWFEVTIHQHMPMFHMEHCVFCAFLSSGSDYTNCGRPCDRHEVKLRDRVGAEHPVKADIGCRNTVFNALAQTGAEYVSRMLALGARHFRIEFLNETPEQVGQTIVRYRQLLRGEIGAPQLWRELKLLNQLGVTRGTLAPPQPGDFAVRP